MVAASPTMLRSMVAFASGANAVVTVQAEAPRPRRSTYHVAWTATGVATVLATDEGDAGEAAKELVRGNAENCVGLDDVVIHEVTPNGGDDDISDPELSRHTAREGHEDADPDGDHVPGTGCEFCNPINGNPFTNRPRGEEWTCPYCNTLYSGEESD